MEGSRIKDLNFYTVIGWMLNILELKGNELIVFAIIYSFSQDAISEFTGSIKYLQDFGNIKSHNTVLAVLGNLVEKKYILKRDYEKDRVHRVAYRVNPEIIEKYCSIKPNNR